MAFAPLDDPRIKLSQLLRMARVAAVVAAPIALAVMEGTLAAHLKRR
ncbi:MAG: hypothetical protein R3F24_03475 [Gammaproteobacteria bacterium]